jgi:chorismate mutase
MFAACSRATHSANGSSAGNEHVSRPLDEIRAELDALDAELIRMVARRLELGLEAARAKRASGMQIVDTGRVEHVVDQARRWATEAGVSEDEVEQIFRRLIALSARAQLDSNPR